MIDEAPPGEMELAVTDRLRLRSLLPKEHGAYAELAVPMLAALMAGAPGIPALVLAMGAWAFFLAHEPALVLLGRRGERARTEHGERALTRLLVLGVAGIVLGSVGLVVSPPVVQSTSLAVAALAIVFVAVVARGHERSTAGEALAAITLAAAALPVGLASGLSVGTAARAWGVWSLGFVAVVIPARSIGARRRGFVPVGVRALPAGLALGIGIALWGPVLGGPELLALVPLVLAGGWLGIARPPPRRLRQVGWSIVAATLLTGCMLVLAAKARV
jgi:hypothetical protein